MPTAIKRRKLAISTKNATTKSRALNAFTTVSKASTTTKEIIEKNFQVDVATTTHQPAACNKRKFVEDEESAQQETISPANTKTDQRRTFLRTPKTPHRPILKQSPPSTIDTPTNGARNLLDRFCIASKTPTRSPLGFSSSSSNLATSIPPTSNLPTELLDMINLHAAFLTALSIHYAHHGTHAPVDLRNLCPDVAQAWGKRRVTLEDVRLLLGIQNSSAPESKDARVSRLSLSDYGHGKICIEIRTLGKGGRIARPVNEDLLNEVFEKGLTSLWEQKRAELDVKEFVEGLPHQGITMCSSLVKMSPLLAKGQRRLEDLRAGITIKSPAIAQKVEVASPKLTLLDRLRAKAIQTAKLPPPPSKADIARQAAMGRIEEVVSILVILSTSTSIGQSRISFTLPTIIGKLRDSFKTPMSKEEADTCIRLLATDIAPQWVKLVKMGKVECLVVNRDERPREGNIKEMVGRA
ncbi:uncharacterized protein RSE6_14899 [Rhynchosporium secalis]|uniref:DNA replication factor Cdt1 C-terminal domain-containing protein n=1 Tax=Rhynchosporium secalis TaxID=38038 RepID=A0A1E1MWD4_RHYSE|nr:uncharacterized protein RSE6_14899 [Rhynchosporium secalis]